MSRFKAIVSYDGSRYGGWQKQPNTHSIQEEIEFALEKINGTPTPITASGRTDALVHAIAQCFHFDAVKELDGDHWRQAINSLLPKDIRIQQIDKVHDEFHARFDCVGKRYDYLITHDVLNPFLEQYMGKDRKILDVAYMQECANVFIGTYDFTSFTSNKIDPRKPRIKTITRAEILQEDKSVRMIFEGNGFLRYMVRMLAGTLIEAGKHRISKEDVEQMLHAKDKHVCRYKAPAQGLYLVKVDYKEE
ncbi:tRNA pseudouridine(38-40) synthase TruA [Amedibacillus sp. YH-ame6]